jgi:hypothetical protein
MEYTIITFAIIAAIAARRQCGWFAAATRLYIAGFYVLALTGIAPPDTLKYVSRVGFLLIFAADIVPVIAEYIAVYKGEPCQRKP